VSFNLTAAVFDMALAVDISSSELVVLATLAHHHNPHTDLCNPSYGLVAKRTHLHRRTVISIVQRLVKAGYIKAVSPGPRRANHYLFTLVVLRHQPSGLTPPPSGLTSPGLVASRHPEQVVEQAREQESPLTREWTAQELVAAVLKYSSDWSTAKERAPSEVSHAVREALGGWQSVSRMQQRDITFQGKTLLSALPAQSERQSNGNKGKP
jgi:hypothetical protein